MGGEGISGGGRGGVGWRLESACDEVGGRMSTCTCTRMRIRACGRFVEEKGCHSIGVVGSVYIAAGVWSLEFVYYSGRAGLVSAFLGLLHVRVRLTCGVFCQSSYLTHVLALIRNRTKPAFSIMSSHHHTLFTGD